MFFFLNHKDSSGLKHIVFSEPLQKLESQKSVNLSSSSRTTPVPPSVMNNLHIFKTQHPIIQRDSLCYGTENIYIQTDGWMHMPCWHLRLFGNKEAAAICQKTQIKWNCHHAVSSCSPSLSLSLSLSLSAAPSARQTENENLCYSNWICTDEGHFVVNKEQNNSRNKDRFWFFCSSFLPASVSRVPVSPGGWCLLYCVSLNNRTMFDNRSTCSDDGASPQGSQIRVSEIVFGI